MAEGEYFSVLAFFIVFREALEAAIVCSVLLSILHQSGQKKLKKWVWIGLVLGLLLTLIILIAVVITFSIAAQDFGFRANKLTQGVLGVTAAVLIAYVCLTIGDLMEKREKIEHFVMQTMEEAEDVDETLSEEEKEAQMLEHMKNMPQDDTWKTILFLTFTAVVREGFETIVFLGVGSGFKVKALPLPIITGGGAGAFCGYLLYKSSGKVALKRFINFSIIFMLFVGAGIFTHGIFEFQEIKDWGHWETFVYNISGCCGLNKSHFWNIFRGVFGYTPAPSRAEMLSYFMYWLVMIILFQIKWYVKRNNIDIKAKICCKKEEGAPGVEPVRADPSGSVTTV